MIERLMFFYRLHRANVKGRIKSLYESMRTVIRGILIRRSIRDKSDE